MDTYASMYPIIPLLQYRYIIFIIRQCRGVPLALHDDTRLSPFLGRAERILYISRT